VYQELGEGVIINSEALNMIDETNIESFPKQVVPLQKLKDDVEALSQFFVR
jgi:hypothetical protein